MTAQIIAALYALAQAIPPLASLCQKLISVLEQIEKQHNVAEAAKRLESKDRLVDAAIDGLPDTSKAEQQPKTDKPAGFH